MTQDVDDRDLLRNTGRRFAHILRQLLPNVPRRRLATKREKRSDGPDGWYMIVAEPVRGVQIHVWLDASLEIWGYRPHGKRAFWVGFYSDTHGKARNLARHIVHDTATESLPPTALDSPILETWAPPDDEHYFGIYFEQGTPLDMRKALTFVCEVLGEMTQFRDVIALDETRIDILALEADESLSATQRAQLIQARIGQGPYRKALEKRWEGQCSVLGIVKSELLRASHVKPWSRSNNKERRDPENGLLLAAHIDALFDKHLITFSHSGMMLISEELSQADRSLLNLGDQLRKPPTPGLVEYLKDHRAEFEKRFSGWRSANQRG